MNQLDQSPIILFDACCATVSREHLLFRKMGSIVSVHYKTLCSNTYTLVVCRLVSLFHPKISCSESSEEREG